jgi:hypothetical protein
MDGGRQVNTVPDTTVSHLRTIIANLRQDGGLMSPSIYDTAQALRFSPPRKSARRTLDWLLTQQHPDGGWGDPAAPKTRDVPTIASILALHTYRHVVKGERAIEEGLSFLRRQSPLWRVPLGEDLPVGAELIMPRLLEDAVASGLDVPTAQYGKLFPLGRRKLEQIVLLQPGAGTPAAFSWEAWGTVPDVRVLDASGGVGHNPAATAYWLSLARGNEALGAQIVAAERYLEQASRATRVGVPGVMPTAWPVDRYEQAFVLHTLLVAGLLDHPQLQDVVQPQLRDLSEATMRADGLGFSDYFVPDGDDTAAAIATLRAAGYPSSFSSLDGFRASGHFIGYHGEFQASHSLTARAIHALYLFEKDASGLQDYLLQSQLPDGRWPGDKWHTSWVYATMMAVFALQQSGSRYSASLRLAIDALETYQHADGGWGPCGTSVMTDTAYGALALYVLRNSGQVNWVRLERAHRWLLDNYRPFDYHLEQGWLNKQQYTPYRIDWGFALSATLALGGMITA